MGILPREDAIPMQKDAIPMQKDAILMQLSSLISQTCAAATSRPRRRDFSFFGRVSSKIHEILTFLEILPGHGRPPIIADG